MKSDAENILNNNEFFVDTVDSTMEGTKQYKKREYLKSAISTTYILPVKINI